MTVDEEIIERSVQISDDMLIELLRRMYEVVNECKSSHVANSKLMTRCCVLASAKLLLHTIDCGVDGLSPKLEVATSMHESICKSLVEENVSSEGGAVH